MSLSPECEVKLEQITDRMRYRSDLIIICTIVLASILTITIHVYLDWQRMLVFQEYSIHMKNEIATLKQDIERLKN